MGRVRTALAKLALRTYLLANRIEKWALAKQANAAVREHQLRRVAKTVFSRKCLDERHDDCSWMYCACGCHTRARETAN